MAINYSIKSENSLLLVKASGDDENLNEVKEYGAAIVEAAISNGSARILCDETELEYKLSVVDSFESAKYISGLAPEVAKIALVYNPKQTNEVAFWETVAVNRGMSVKSFMSTSEAREWLK